MERANGLEPLPIAWKANMLPLTPYPLKFMVAPGGIEPPLERYKHPLLPLKYEAKIILKLVIPAGFEPATTTLKGL